MPRSTDQLREESADGTRELAAAIEAFTQRFGRRPTLAAIAPGRINLIGEHTDYNDGFVLPMAIQRQTIIVADRASGRPSTFIAQDLNETASVDLTASLSRRPDFSNCLLGVADQFVRRGHALQNIDALITSTIPIGAGLSSSAALEVAFALVVEQALGLTLEPLERAKLCRAAEHAFPGTPCGIMDMLTATMARADTAMLIDCRTMNVQHIPMPSPDAGSILVMDTGVKHNLASSRYAERRRECEEAARAFGVRSLRDATTPFVRESSLCANLRQRAMHVVTENTRTSQAANALAAGDFSTLGDLLFAGHDSLRDLFEVSCPELDVLVEAARGLRGNGVFGARMTGGGFGGCVIVLCRPEAAHHVQQQLSATFEQQFGHPCIGFTTRAAGAARSIPLQ